MLSANGSRHDPRSGYATGEASDSLYPGEVHHERRVLQLARGMTEKETAACGLDVSIVELVDTGEQQLAGLDSPRNDKLFSWMSASTNQVDDSFDCLIPMADNKASCVAPSGSAGGETAAHGWDAGSPRVGPNAVSASDQNLQ